MTIPESAIEATRQTLQEIHGDGDCHICGKPKIGKGDKTCSYPHGMVPVEAVDENHPEGCWTWEIPVMTDFKIIDPIVALQGGDMKKVYPSRDEEITRLSALNAELLVALEEIIKPLSIAKQGARKECDQLNEIIGWIQKTARAAIARAKCEPKLEPQTYKIQPPTFVPKD